MGDLKQELEKALARYNEFRSPEAVAELLELSGEEALLRFRGSFCHTCGVYDYFEDLLGYIEGEILSVEKGPEGFLVRFRFGKSGLGR